jgi:glycosyltransferase involved in cell wall biosynthesis/1-acyl-sn-glycerol-3-phosphate acyltransferase
VTIVFVVDDYLSQTNGTHVSARRFREELITLGHTVRVLSIGVEGPDMFGLKEHYIPVVTPVAKLSNLRFAKFDRNVALRALDGADVAHMFYPWQLQRKTSRLAEQMGIPVTGAFHCPPGHITYNIGLGWFSPLAEFVYWLFRVRFYRNIENIHCPSSLIAGELKKHKYRARFHVISNGVSGVFKPGPQTGQTGQTGVRENDEIRVLMSGRLAPEKRQDLVIKAVQRSKYKDRIQLYFTGQGACLKKYKKLGASLPRPPIFGFVSPEQLVETMRGCDIYVHASDVEAEGLACLEALACGKVPIISDSNKSATSQFALDNRSLFKKGSCRDLRDKLDWWIEHPEELKAAGQRYAGLGQKYNISYSAQKLLTMFTAASMDYASRQMIKRREEKTTAYYWKIRRGWTFKKIFGFCFYYCIAIPILALINLVYFGLKVENKRVLKKIKHTGAVTICNHIHDMDSEIWALTVFPRKPIFTSLPRNFSLGMAGVFVELLGAVPIPMSVNEMRIFIYTISKYLRKGLVVHFYPEGELREYSTELSEFKRGAFYLAVDAQVPVLPMKILCREPAGLYRLFKKGRPCFTLVLGEPLYPNSYALKKEAISDIQKRAEECMNALGSKNKRSA